MFEYLSSLDKILTYIVIISGALITFGIAAVVGYKILTAEKIKAGPIEIEAEEEKIIIKEVADEPKKRNKK